MFGMVVAKELILILEFLILVLDINISHWLSKLAQQNGHS